MKPSFKNFFQKKKGVRGNSFRILYPEREWFLGLLFAFCIFAGCAAYATLTFMRSTERADVGVVEVVEARGVVYDRDRVARVLKEYSVRVERFDTLRKDAPMPAVQATSTPVATQRTVVEKEATSTPGLQSGNLTVE